MSSGDTADAIAVAFGDCRVIVQAGDLLDPALGVEGLVSSDDNYFSMAGGVSAAVLAACGPEVRDAAQVRSPVRAGDVIVTGAGALQTGSVRAILHAAVVDLDADIALQPENIGRWPRACALRRSTACARWRYPPSARVPASTPSSVRPGSSPRQ